MTARDWRIDVRDRNRQRVGQLDRYEQLDMALKLNDVSTWRLIVDRRNRLAADLLADGAGIIVYRKGAVFLSGYWTEQNHDRDKDTNQVVLSGVDDTDWLNHRLAYPDPDDITPPYTTQAQDTRTGVASTVIREFIDENGGLATNVARRIAGLFAGIEVDPLVGPTVTGSGRWQKALQLCQEMATASEEQGVPIAFRIVQSDDDLLLELRACEDKSDTVKFSFELGNLAGFQYKRTRPTRTYAHVGGNGEGTARTFFERPKSVLVAAWGRIEDDLLDSRNGNTANELAQTADEGLKEGADTNSLSITPLDVEWQKFGDHYGLGDKVSVQLDSVGPLADTVIADTEAQGTSITTDYLISLEADALPFVDGMRVRIETSDGHAKEPGVRVVKGRTTAFGFTNIEFNPPALVSTVAGDHLVGLSPPVTVGETVTDLVREVGISLTADGEKVAPVIGSTTKITPNRLFAVQRDTLNRVRNLERR